MKNLKIFFLLILLSARTLNIYPIVILIHGTFASDAEWCSPCGKFYKILKNEANKIKEKLISFGWSGNLTNGARIEAAEALAQIILTYVQDKQIILIGHSHGGNVINLASKMLASPSRNNTVFKKKSDISAFIQASSRLKKINGNSKREYLIDQVYLLGTPINKKKYAPDMKIIKYLCNMFSKADFIQPVFGLYEQIIKNIDRVVNLEITINDDEIEDDSPSHYQMHHNIIAKWILSIPHKLKESKLGGFHEFKWNTDGKVHFEAKKPPIYKPIKKIYEYIENINN